jgi:amidase
VATFIERTGAAPVGLRIAVKDLVDLAGYPTTAGCRAVADVALAARDDAPCLEGIRRAEAAGAATIVGKTNLHELAFGVTGINPWFGTPVNPLDPLRIPGGSSSGSAVAVAAGEADVALGSDTGGSIRIPAACCAIAGLKTTWGRIPLDGVQPLAPSMDTIGPMARDVDGLIAGMALLCPGFAPGAPAARIGRLRLAGTNPAVDASIDRALALAGIETEPVALERWGAANRAAAVVLAAEAWATDGHLLETVPDRIGTDVVERLSGARAVTPTDVAHARLEASAFTAELAALFARVEVLALPTLTDVVPELERAEEMFSIRATLAWNLIGVPALALALPGVALPPSIQLVGAAGSEERLVATALVIEAAWAAG